MFSKKQNNIESKISEYNDKIINISTEIKYYKELLKDLLYTKKENHDLSINFFSIKLYDNFISWKMTQKNNHKSLVEQMENFIEKNIFLLENRKITYMEEQEVLEKTLEEINKKERRDIVTEKIWFYKKEYLEENNFDIQSGLENLAN